MRDNQERTSARRPENLRKCSQILFGSLNENTCGCRIDYVSVRSSEKAGKIKILLNYDEDFREKVLKFICLNCFEIQVNL